MFEVRSFGFFVWFCFCFLRVVCQRKGGSSIEQRPKLEGMGADADLGKAPDEE